MGATTDDVYSDWTDLYESTLLFYRWLTMNDMPCIAFRHGSLSIARRALDQFMKEYRRIAYRYEGMGLKITKFHQIRHWYFYIAMYGVPTNFDSSFCESHHINLTKRTGRRTQKRQDELARQTSQRVYEGTLLDATLSRCNFYRHIKPRGRRGQGTHRNGLSGSSFVINFDYTSIDARLEEGNLKTLSIHDVYHEIPDTLFRWNRKRNSRKKPFPAIVLESIVAKLSWLNDGDITKRIKSINGATEVNLPSNREQSKRSFVRAHPDYREIGLWMDWVDIRWELEEDDGHYVKIPAQVLMILDFNSIVYEEIPQTTCGLFANVSTGNMIDTSDEHRVGIRVLVHSAADNGIRDFDPVKDSIVSRYIMEPFFQLVDLNNIDSICFVARDSIDDQENPMIYGISKVLDPQLWGLVFIPRYAHDYEEPKDNELHLNEFNESYNPRNEIVTLSHDIPLAETN